MVCHGRYVLDNLFGNVREREPASAAPHIPERWDEKGKKYKGDRG